MNEPILISGNSEAELMQRLATHLQKEPGAFQHLIALQQGSRRTLLEVDIDPGGGFESGYATTRLSAPVAGDSNFSFSIHPEGFLADVAKLFGGQDVVIGYPEFDEKVIIKTNDEEAVRALFADESLRQSISTLRHFTLQLRTDDEGRQLVLELEEGITDPATLSALYQTFSQIAARVEAGA